LLLPLLSVHEKNPKSGRLTGDMMSFEFSIKSIFVEESASNVAPGVVVAGSIPTVNTLILAFFIVGGQLHGIAEAFHAGFDDRDIYC
jgi:hypothetical protein